MPLGPVLGQPGAVLGVHAGQQPREGERMSCVALQQGGGCPEKKNTGIREINTNQPADQCQICIPELLIVSVGLKGTE